MYTILLKNEIFLLPTFAFQQLLDEKVISPFSKDNFMCIIN